MIENSQLKNPQNEIVYNPCLFKGYQSQFYLNTSNPNEASSDLNYTTMEGTGEPLKCREIIRQTLWPEGCPSGGPCPVDNIQHPPVDGAFFGIVSIFNQLTFDVIHFLIVFIQSVYFFAFDCVRHYGNKDLLHW